MEQRFKQVLSLLGLRNCRILIAVSGGVDSIVLLDLLAGLRDEFSLRLNVLHVDHGLRPESPADAEFVMDLCQRLNIPCQIKSFDVEDIAREKRLSLETAGRETRRAVLLAEAKKFNCDRIVLAHHRNDQAETFLQRLLRGSGLSGLQAMRMEDGIWWRPLLDFSRSQIVDYATQRKLAWVEDASNRDTTFLRNQIRHQLIPQLCEYNPQIVERLATLSQQLQSEEDFWQKQVEGLWPEFLLSHADGVRLSVPFLNENHPALQKRLLREGLRQLRGDLRGIESVHIDSLLGLTRGLPPQAEIDLPGCWAARRYDQLWLRLKRPVEKEFDLALYLDVPLMLPDGRTLVAEIHDGSAGEDLSRVEFDADLIHFPLRVRSSRAGDRFRPSGMSGHRKIKDILVDLKVEKELRKGLPILLSKDEILWLGGLRRSVHAPVTDSTSKILAVRLLKARDTATNAL